MTKLLDWLERRLGRFAIPDVTTGLIVGQVAVFVAVMLRQDAASLRLLVLAPQAVWQGEVWRVLTVLFVPPPTSPIFILFFWYLFWMFGSALESSWGAFRYNLYLLIGWVASVAVALAVGQPIRDCQFLYYSVFLAFATLVPDFTIRLFFILPIKIKWLALLVWLGYGLTLINGSNGQRLMVAAAVLNYVLFFSPQYVHNLKADARRRSFQSKAAPRGRMRHECRVCGRNSDDEPRTQFRYCSKCAGQSCYCPDHIQDHEHVAEKSA